MIQLMQGDCLEVLKTLDDNSVDSVVTDPPYGLGFMGKKWDIGVPAAEVFIECLRVLKPGGHLLAFGGSRTYHRLAVAVEDAGFEIRDQIMWVYGSGFPKSLDVSKAIDKAAGTEATEDAKQWQGWGTALKPAHEPIVVARKPLAKGSTVAANVLEHGTGALNIDGCRVSADDGQSRARPPRTPNAILGGGKGTNLTASEHNAAGRWPANLIHDGSEEVMALFPVTKSGAIDPAKHNHKHGKGNALSGSKDGSLNNYQPHQVYKADTGSAARFFYCAKASKKDRDEGCEGLEAKSNMRVNGPRESEEAKHATKRSNHHPTVKPTDLMRYLCRLVTPPSGVVLDPFMGSGSTGKAAVLEGFGFIGIELDPNYFEIAKQRIEAAQE